MSLEHFIYTYSNGNLTRLWNSFSLRTRDGLKSSLELNDIDVNKSFEEQSGSAQNEIIKRFKQHGVGVFISRDKEEKQKEKSLLVNKLNILIERSELSKTDKSELSIFIKNI